MSKNPLPELPSTRPPAHQDHHNSLSVLRPVARPQIWFLDPGPRPPISRPPTCSDQLPYFDPLHFFRNPSCVANSVTSRTSSSGSCPGPVQPSLALIPLLLNTKSQGRCLAYSLGMHASVMSRCSVFPYHNDAGRGCSFSGREHSRPRSLRKPRGSKPRKTASGLRGAGWVSSGQAAG